MEAGKPTAVKGRGTEFYYPAITTNFGRPKALPHGDLPPTPAEAMRCPEVAALVEAVRHEREMVCQDWDLQMEASKNVEKALGNMGVYPYSGVV